MTDMVAKEIIDPPKIKRKNDMHIDAPKGNTVVIMGKNFKEILYQILSRG